MKFLEIIFSDKKINNFYNELLTEQNYETIERWKNREWELKPDCPEIGLKAHALLKVLVDKKEFEELTIEEAKRKYEIKELLEDGGLTDEEETKLVEELEEYDNKICVYDLEPDREYYDMNQFLIEGSNDEYAVGTYDEFESSGYESVKQFIDENGYSSFSAGFVDSHLDMGRVESFFEQIASDDINETPEAYIPESLRQLTRDQEDEIDVLEQRIEDAKTTIENINNYINNLKKYDNKNLQIYNEKIEKLNEFIESQEQEIEEIKDNPEGDFSEEDIERSIKDKVDEYMDDPQYYLDSYGADISNYVDEDEFIKAALDADGPAHFLNTYDGNYEEVRLPISKELYIVIRTG